LLEEKERHQKEPYWPDAEKAIKLSEIIFSLVKKYDNLKKGWKEVRGEVIQELLSFYKEAKSNPDIKSRFERVLNLFDITPKE